MYSAYAVWVKPSTTYPPASVVLYIITHFFYFGKKMKAKTGKSILRKFFLSFEHFASRKEYYVIENKTAGYFIPSALPK